MFAVEFPAGVTTLLSRSAKVANWHDSNLMRWDDITTLRPVNGWEQVPYPNLPGTSSPFASRVRGMHKWVTQNGIYYTAFLCESHVYIDTGGTLADITPIDGMDALGGTEAGYGEFNYNEDTYGTPRAGNSTITKFSPAFSINNWGEDLLVMTSSDARLLIWSPSTPLSPLVRVPGSPFARQFVVTPEHHCMLFGLQFDTFSDPGGVNGLGSFAHFGWCSSENIEDWNFADPLNTAGMFTVDPYAPIIAAHSSAVGITLHTPAMTHVVEYIGLPYVYRYRPIGKVPIPISAASISSIPEGIVWISVEGYWMFNGSTADTIPCPVWDVISKNMDFERTVRESHSVSILAKGEIWWFWVDSSISVSAARYVAIDYRSKVWMSGYLQRTCGITYANDRFPIMSDGAKIWKHESGYSYPGAIFMPYLESQTMMVADGERFGTITKLLADIAGDKSALAFRLALQNDRSDYSSQKYTHQRTVNQFGWVDIRETARDIRLRIDMIKNSDWSTVGPIIFDIKPRGKKT